MSVIVVNITVAATAGSILKYDNIKGIAAPKVPAKIRLKSIAKAIIEPNKKSLNQNPVIIPISKAKNIPLYVPTNISFPKTLNELEDVNSLVAIALTATVNVWVPALPPIDATIGIKIAKDTI